MKTGEERLTGGEWRYSQGVVTAKPGWLIIETEQDRLGAHAVEREDRVLP